MDTQSLANVLEMLRRLKEEAPSVTVLTVLTKWTQPTQSDPGSVLRMAYHVQEQLRAAHAVISNIQLPDEAKAGVRHTLDTLSSSFSLKELNSPAKQGLSNIEGPISNFVMHLSMAGVSERHKVPPEAVEFAKEVEAMMAQFDDAALDPVIRDIAKRHLATLATLLRNIPIFGVEAAMAAYFEMIILLRRASVNTSKESKSKTTALFETLETWRDRFETIDKLWNIGVRWVGGAAGAGALLLQHLQ